MTAVGARNWRDYALLFALACCWSSTYPLAKLALPTIPPITFISARSLIAAAFLFAIATHVLDSRAVTTNFACEFLDAAREGELVECVGEVSRAGGSLIFLRGKLTSAGRPLFTFSGTIKRVKRKPALQPNA